MKHNLTLISKISLFHSLGFPILLVLPEKDLLIKYLVNMTAKIEQEEQ